MNAIGVPPIAWGSRTPGSRITSFRKPQRGFVPLIRSTLLSSQTGRNPDGVRNPNRIRSQGSRTLGYWQNAFGVWLNLLARAKGATGFFRKPVDFDLMFECIRQVLFGNI